MPQAIVDPAELRRFAHQLKQFNNELHNQMAVLHGQLVGLGSTWRDQEHVKFTEEFELTMTKADADWVGSRIGFTLEPREDSTWVQFYHRGWPAENEHYRISSHCWAMYLRVLRRWLEYDEEVAYEQRLVV